MTDVPSDGLPAHSRFGASVAKRWMHCHGSVQAEAAALARGEADDEAGPHAAMGTAGHWLLESVLLGKFYNVPRAWVGLEAPNGIALDEQTVANVEECLREIQNMRDRIAGPFGLDPVVLLSERRVTMFDLDPEFFGTSDVICIGLAKIAILDFKNGSGVEVPVWDEDGLNPQGAYYALGALRIADKEFPGWRRGVADPEIEVNICQPARGGIKTRTVRESDLNAIAAKMVAAAAKARQPNAERAAGSWCKFCKAHGSCATAAASSLERARMHFSDQSQVVALADPRNLSPEDRAAAQRALPVLRAWCDAVESLNVKEAMRGRPAPGWKLVQGEGNRRWIDPPKAFALLQLVYGLKPEDFYEGKPRTPAAIERILSAEDRKNALAGLTERPPSGYSLVAVDDPRGAVSGASRWFTPQQIGSSKPPDDDPFA